MRYREKHKVDWDEEIRKTERIRRKGLFISALGLGVAALFILGLNRTGAGFAEVGRKFIFALCVILAMFLTRIIWRRGERLKSEKQDKEQERMRIGAPKSEK
jgi:hypothetical protein